VTYSLVAGDPVTGELGVVVQSHFFSVGSVVPWAAPGGGAVATHAAGRIDYSPRGSGRRLTPATSVEPFNGRTSLTPSVLDVTSQTPGSRQTAALVRHRDQPHGGRSSDTTSGNRPLAAS